MVDCGACACASADDPDACGKDLASCMSDMYLCTETCAPNFPVIVLGLACMMSEASRCGVWSNCWTYNKVRTVDG